MGVASANHSQDDLLPSLLAFIPQPTSDDAIVKAIKFTVDRLHLDTIDPITINNAPLASPEAPMSRSGSVSSTEVNDHLTPLRDTTIDTDRLSLLRKNPLSPRSSAQPNFSSPTLPSLSELLVSPPLPDEHEQRQSYFPSYPQFASSSTPPGLSTSTFNTSSTPRTPSEHEMPIKAASDSGTFATARRFTTNRSPRIKNSGGILAPHGSFTSSRSRSSTMTANQAHPSANKADDTSSEMDPREREKLFRAAAKGDQLAMHRLGWPPLRTVQRHTLGSTEDIWGAHHLSSNIARRSSASSQTSLSVAQTSDGSSSPATQSPTPSTTAPAYTQSDLFSDAVTLTLRSNALMNNRNPNAPVTTTKALPRRSSNRKGSK